MAKINLKSEKSTQNDSASKRTSIGVGPHSRPSTKDQRRTWKKYRGQGR